MRARNYNPATGRFLTEDTHWNPANRIYGDYARKINERQDPNGLNYYTYVPDVAAIRQSSNLYAYALNNPIAYIDEDGEIALLVITGAVGAIGGAIYGGVKAASKGESVVKGALTYGTIGGAIGLTGGAAAGALLAGSVAASAAAVGVGANTLAVAMSSGGLAAGGTFIAQNFKNMASGFTVLGHNPGYLDLAKQLNARVFDIDPKVWSTLSSAKQWVLNQEFLSTSMAKGHQFILSTNAYSARIDSFFQAEINFLLNNGYRIVDEGWRLIK